MFFYSIILNLVIMLTESIQLKTGGVMVSVLASSAEGLGFDPRLGKTKDIKIGICCFFAKHAALRIMSKDWLAQSQNVSRVMWHVFLQTVAFLS